MVGKLKSLDDSLGVRVNFNLDERSCEGILGYDEHLRSYIINDGSGEPTPLCIRPLAKYIGVNSKGQIEIRSAA